MRKKGIPLLLFWLLGVVFPVAWLANFSTDIHHILDTVFAPEWIHWMIHAALYAGLAILVVVIFNLSLNHRTVLQVLGVVLLVGVMQEGMQLFSGVQILGWNSLFDLVVDLIGAGIGLCILWIVRKTSEKIKSPQA